MSDFNYGDRVKIDGEREGVVEGLSLGMYTVRIAEGFFTRREQVKPERLTKAEPKIMSAWDGHKLVSVPMSECAGSISLIDPTAGLRAEVAALKAEVSKSHDMIETAWGIICNAGRGNWRLESKEWQEAAARFRIEYNALLDRICHRKGPEAYTDGYSPLSESPPPLTPNQVVDRDKIAAMYRCPVKAETVKRIMDSPAEVSLQSPPLPSRRRVEFDDAKVILIDYNAVEFKSPCPACGDAISLRTAAYISPSGVAHHVGCADRACVDERTKDEMRYAIRHDGAGKLCKQRTDADYLATCACSGKVVYSYFTDDGRRCAACIRKMIADAPIMSIDGPVIVNAGTKDEYRAESVEVHKTVDTVDTSRFFNSKTAKSLSQDEWSVMASMERPIGSKRFRCNVVLVYGRHTKVTFESTEDTEQRAVDVATIQAFDAMPDVESVRDQLDGIRSRSGLISLAGISRIDKPVFACDKCLSKQQPFRHTHAHGVLCETCYQASDEVVSCEPYRTLRREEFAAVAIPATEPYEGICQLCEREGTITPGRQGACNDCAAVALAQPIRTEGDDMMEFFKGTNA